MLIKCLKCKQNVNIRDLPVLRSRESSFVYNVVMTTSTTKKNVRSKNNVTKLEAKITLLLLHLQQKYVLFLTFFSVQSSFPLFIIIMKQKLYFEQTMITLKSGRVTHFGDVNNAKKRHK